MQEEEDDNQEEKDQDFLEEWRCSGSYYNPRTAARRDKAVNVSREEREDSQRYPQAEQSKRLSSEEELIKRDQNGNSLIYKSNEDLFRDKKVRPWKKAKRFIQLPRIIVADRRLSNEAVRLACILSMFDMSKKKQGKEQGLKIHEGIVFPSITTLSEAMGRSEPMIIKYVNELHDASYLVRRKRFTKTNLYIMWLPIITSIEELVANYRCFACPLTADDFNVNGNISRKDLEFFFEIVKSLKQEYRNFLKSGEKKMKYDELEKLALEEYQSRKASKD